MRSAAAAFRSASPSSRTVISVCAIAAAGTVKPAAKRAANADLRDVVAVGGGVPMVGSNKNEGLVTAIEKKAGEREVHGAKTKRAVVSSSSLGRPI
eukprot:CAMPEP_0194330868 /NCGR_PEP_ID=MMETSP0171-20130528/53614_1 /TAXON_ID=218684 /ORGANISM="Corethron pennatum, Strain L29A3" /LENGTH=95 /DNA_ID=CAMNT_0039092101 /DNA_START=106 /DNA_END=390 /DNA_ORIENTATION=-